MSYSQKIIFIEKDSNNIFTFKDLVTEKVGHLKPESYPYYTDTFGNNLVQWIQLSDKIICRQIVKYDGKDFFIVKSDTALFIEPKKGYFVFKDGTIAENH